MIIKKFVTGVYDVNTYLLIDTDSKEAAVIDYGGHSDEILSELKENNLTLKYILNTHGHFDHISGENELQKSLNAPVYVNKGDELLVKMLKPTLATLGFPLIEPPKIDEFLDEKSQLTIADNQIKVLLTPGHTRGCVSFLVGDDLFSGDTLFYESVGRTDLPGGDYNDIVKSVQTKLFVLDDSIKVYPGHGCETTIGHEKRHNPYVK